VSYLRAGFSIECLSTVTCLRFGCNLTLHLAGVKVGDSLETDNDSMVGVLSIHLNCTDNWPGLQSLTGLIRSLYACELVETVTANKS
jgi:hypothetical protein